MSSYKTMGLQVKIYNNTGHTLLSEQDPTPTEAEAVGNDPDQETLVE